MSREGGGGERGREKGEERREGRKQLIGNKSTPNCVYNIKYTCTCTHTLISSPTLTHTHTHLSSGTWVVCVS